MSFVARGSISWAAQAVNQTFDSLLFLWLWGGHETGDTVKTHRLVLVWCVANQCHGPWPSEICELNRSVFRFPIWLTNICHVDLHPGLEMRPVLSTWHLRPLWLVAYAAWWSLMMVDGGWWLAAVDGDAHGGASESALGLGILQESNTWLVR